MISQTQKNCGIKQDISWICERLSTRPLISSIQLKLWENLECGNAALIHLQDNNILDQYRDYKIIVAPKWIANITASNCSFWDLYKKKKLS